MKRTKPKSKRLATAKPNKLYKYYKNCMITIRLEAWLKGDRVFFKEHWHGLRSISEDMVKECFPEGKSIEGQPFRKQENREFYTVLYRHRKRYKQKFENLKHK